MTTLLTLVCFAVNEEAAFFRKLCSTKSNVRLWLTGIGKRNSEKSIRMALTQERPGLVISSGFAGALRAGLNTGDIVYSADLESGLEPALAALGARRVEFYCAEQIAGTAAEKQTLRSATGADVIEMESDVIRRVCREKGIASATIRVILDTCSEDLPLDFNRLMTQDQKLDAGKLALALIKSPTKIPAVLGLQKQSKAAARQLGETLANVLLK